MNYENIPLGTRLRTIGGREGIVRSTTRRNGTTRVELQADEGYDYDQVYTSQLDFDARATVLGWVEATTPFKIGDEIRVEYEGPSGFPFYYEGILSQYGVDMTGRECIRLVDEDLVHYLTRSHRFYKRSN